MAQALLPDLLEGNPPAVTIRAGNALGSILEDTDAQVALPVVLRCRLLQPTCPRTASTAICIICAQHFVAFAQQQPP